MDQLEIEIKFYLSDASAMRRSILERGATSLGRVFETNIRFEDQQNCLFQKRSLLRLRKDNKTRLTFKSQPDFIDPNFKILKELEVEVSDFSTMTKILKAIGFHEAQIYEKWRETFLLDGVTLLLDTMPFGDFLEIEGNRDQILNLTDRLGLKWKNRILLNYLELFDIIKQNLNLPFSDVTFEKFKKIQVDLASCLHLFVAGA